MNSISLFLLSLLYVVSKFELFPSCIFYFSLLITGFGSFFLCVVLIFPCLDLGLPECLQAYFPSYHLFGSPKTSRSSSCGPSSLRSFMLSVSSHFGEGGENSQLPSFYYFAVRQCANTLHLQLSPPVFSRCCALRALFTNSIRMIISEFSVSDLTNHSLLQVLQFPIDQIPRE